MANFVVSGICNRPSDWYSFGSHTCFSFHEYFIGVLSRTRRAAMLTQYLLVVWVLWGALLENNDTRRKMNVLEAALEISLKKTSDGWLLNAVVQLVAVLWILGVLCIQTHGLNVPSLLSSVILQHIGLVQINSKQWDYKNEDEAEC